MAHIALRGDPPTIEEPTFVEGLPGVGLVGKIAADHLVESLDMTYYADVICDGLPPVAVYRGGNPDLQPPVRLYADTARNLVVLQSDVPISPATTDDFAGCIVGWLDEHDALPLFLSGMPSEKDGSPPTLYGVATGDGAPVLDAHEIDAPRERGVVAGPTGALLHRTGRDGLQAVGLVVESDPQFPDPEAAHVLLRNGIGPIADIEVDTSDLVDRAEEIRDQKEQLARQMQEGGEESTRAEPLRMYQ